MKWVEEFCKYRICIIPQGADEATVWGGVEIYGEGEEAAVDEDGGEEEEQREGLKFERSLEY